MTHQRVATPVQNYVESEDLIFEIGDEDIETPKKKVADDHVGYGFEAEPEEDDVVGSEDEIDEFADFEWGDEEEGDL
ncbi:MAG: hypothetical protein UY31_C0017G0013 [Candidatus Wolfebacteria bacterium GW2011_GWE1_48_7]|uniref:Uncharacterized protein n=2 Tax=Candidatus Wolfeibacteriota TaxID=1752735 RepID=A0A0G1U3S0_9BACT|nr:MAG: hypothetical protein UX70_C0001G0202 [Candidatus Wolfebacteria bacterium GW2011_GWB1_47_1]KKQ38290.1 MAG: hypothetical protein US56_C0046G0005 [Candidatus Moranbacteria bacterium GW2011_GWF2_37_7]KKU36814.1 MAG: hypothetical protein UX49_C0008G0007 [Candidatus Wolfebacteria bacterium GW2011_GWC2_46_275]KKU42004.1 MAG: hypothetical protein UX58_C0004G0063 [Candidatus Wolfebacteria bacterium GW2011_GWB2_46_69]KKU54460.1 MAG: hypothetical protein UX76_C0002G0053 [Candidatus Wolfebacteria b